MNSHHYTFLYNLPSKECPGPETADNRKVWYNGGEEAKAKIGRSLSRRPRAGLGGFMPRKRLDNGLGAVRLNARSIRRSVGMAH